MKRRCAVLAGRTLGRGGRLLVVMMLILGLDLVTLAPRPAAAVTLSGVTGSVASADGLNLRTKASMSGRRIATLPNGTKLIIVGTSGDWFKVNALGKTGYVNSWYVTLIGTPSREISRGNTKRKMVALTFDAGSDLGNTQLIIETLEEYGITASFGLTGAWISAYPDYAAWIAADGHQILNHTLNHPSYTGASDPSGPISPAKRLSQLVANESKIHGIGGQTSKPYWRPPFGDRDWSVLRDVGAAGYGKTVLWTIDTMGWNGATADQIYQKVVNNVGNGVIVLMHVGAASSDASALERIINTLLARGFAFGTVAQTIAP
jgi:peptidoglycan/xylan/chitin deacetylase (PgdA/CDA1 family)